MRWLFRKKKELDHRADQARAEVEQARQRARRTREEVVNPLRRHAGHNQFMQLIRDSLLEGRDRQ